MPTVTAPDGVRIAFAEHGPPDGPVVVLLHGFPELGSSWRHQWPALAQQGYRTLVPDLRGFGDSDAPDDPDAYVVTRTTQDVLALLDHAGADTAVVVGHDWGADLAWKTAWLHPDRVSAVAGMSVPFVPRAPAPPTQLLRQGLGDDFYMVFFQDSPEAEEALAKDVRRTLTTTKQWSRSWAQDTTERPERPAFLTKEELQHYVATYERTGFRGGLGYYRALDANWRATEAFDDRRITMPALFLTGTRDPVKAFMPAAAMEGWVLDREDVEVEGAGHWVQQEAPEEVNRALLRFLARHRPPTAGR